MIRVRFAPTPTGSVFLSAARVALANYLCALKGRGRMLLRLDDLGRDNAHREQIEQDLQWLGIVWDDFFRQSERLELYQRAIERLKRDQFIYPCFESEEELKAKAEFRRKRGQNTIYDRAMLSLTEKQRTDAEAGGKQPHWRFKLSGRTMDWNDMVQGKRHASLLAVSDPILVKADGTPSPILASVIDDIDYGTTHIIRGEDNAGNTAIQIELAEVLGARTPFRFGHLPAISDHAPAGRAPAGRRIGSVALRGLRADGVEPSAIITCMAGLDPADGGSPSLAELARRFDIRETAAIHFDMPHLLEVNRSVLAKLDFAAVASRLPNGSTEAFWLAVRGGLDMLKEARGWWDVVTGTIVPPVIDGARDLLQAANRLLPPEPWDRSVWTTWITAIAQSTQLSGDDLAIPLRLALTGEDGGPDLADLLPLIGRSRAATRLAIAMA